MSYHLRVAHPVSDIARAASMYGAGLELCVLGVFEDHQGFDGVMLGKPDTAYHFEFTYCRTHPVPPSPTPEDLAVFYVSDIKEWEDACIRMEAAGFVQVASLNPYWDICGRTFQDHDGYRIVLQNAAWSNEQNE
jgi:YycE-like N-terminal domain/YycE-like C-terminal domain